MKKSVIIAIGIIYIAAIVLVGLLGQKIHIYDPSIYATSIECYSENYKEYLEEEKQSYNADGAITVFFVKGVKVDLKCKALPNDVSNNDLDYIYDRERFDETKVLFVENADHTASFTFYEPEVLIVTVKAADGHGATLKIKILVLDL